MTEESQLVGWREWCALPALNLPAIKAKLDTGAKTSALHAYDIERYRKRNKELVKFCIHPIQGNRQIVVCSQSEIIDQRTITSSNGHREHRYVILENVQLGHMTWPIELTLSNRDPLKFRMLLGRDALKHRVIINPARSFCQGRIDATTLKKLY